MKSTIVFLLLISGLVLAFREQEDHIFLIPEGWPKPSYSFKNNRLTDEKIELGRLLFYDAILSANNRVSCASCHSQYTAFTHVDHALSHGIDDRIGSRNSASLMNLAWSKSFMWDGAINHLDMQSLFPITHPDEMGETIEHVVLKLQQSKRYPSLYYQAFGDSVPTGANTLKAISQFMLTLISSETRYDSVMRKQTAFTLQEKNGYQLFKKNCNICHTEPLFTNQLFENNGLTVDDSLLDFGRMRVTKNPEDSIKFKVPTLRNIEFSSPYMHDGRIKNLKEVINHYTGGIEQSKTLALPLRKPILLSAEEKVDLVAFLLTLTDRNFLFNPQFNFPKELLVNKNQK